MSKPEPKYEGNTVSLGKVKGKVDFKLSRGTLPTVSCEFSYEDGWNQGLGARVADMEYLKSFLEAFNAKKLNDVSGYIWVEHSHDSIDRLVPLSTEKGEEFDIREWAEKLQENS